MSAGEKKDGHETGDEDGITKVEFNECYSTTVYFDEEFVTPAADGYVEVPITAKDGSLTISLAGTTDNAILLPTEGGNTYLAIPTLRLDEDYLELVVQNDDDSTRSIKIPVEGKTEDAITVPYKLKDGSYYKIPLEDGGYMKLPAVGKKAKSIKIPVDDGMATFPVHDDEGGFVPAQLVRRTDDYLKRIRVRTYNATRGRIETVQKTVTADDLRVYQKSEGSIAYAWTFNVFQFYDSPLGAGDKILSVTANGKTFDNPNDCGSKPSKGHDYDKDGEVDLGKVSLIPVCVDAETDMARFRVENGNEKPITVIYGVDDTSITGQVTVKPTSTTYFEVPAPDGEALVGIFYDGEQVDAARSATETGCIPRNRLGFDARCYDPDAKKARFYVRSGAHAEKTFVYRVAETGETGTVTIPDDLTNAEVFWVAAPDGEATVTLYYEGHPVATATVDPKEHC
ncbi:hypothetical protein CHINAEXTREME_00670 [Halobiforma lacisalsi AJ5]|uniref:Uncharacterized protein n=1 Tax=Natronobacterium lacisalsi AJ5 TaxID=358396 RepID=M0L1C4_NATLA|nr:hypothetical protein [Halobiforma lacisalsi]APW96364.1 hypothetical protein CHINAEXTREME_00670 [Halobiforma lacisalsi AJ5]EMA27362.1 hypothetical protein C445_20320 [Halobiforma lacisalsi AJ5]